MAKKKIKGQRCQYCEQVRPLSRVKKMQGITINGKTPFLCSMCEANLLSEKEASDSQETT